MKPKRNYIFNLIFMLIFVIFFVTVFSIETQEEFYLKNIELVVSRYNETLNWLDTPLYNKYSTVVYNKGSNEEFNHAKNITKIIPLENVGKEGHTYLYHIIQNYNNLADITVFLPGSCDLSHKYINSIKIITTVENTNDTCFILENNGEDISNIFNYQEDNYKVTHNNNKFLNNNIDSNTMKPSNMRPFGNWFVSHFGDMKTKYSYYGIFAVNKKDILQHPVEYYQELIKELETSWNSEVGHYIERSWVAIFKPSYDTIIR